jgi:hypothetical protein
MGATRSTSAQPQTNNRDLSTTSGPFSPKLDADLVSIILKLEQLYNEGKRTFVIVAHRDPDADAMAGCLGMDRLIKGILPGDVTVRWMHDGTLSDSLRQVCGSTTEPVSALPLLFDSVSEETVAIVVVDQTGLHSAAVLPANLESDIRLKSREADVILDHHGDARHEPGIVSAPEVGCTAALVYRLLELARNHERFRTVTWSPEEDSRLALLVNIGARTDASQKVVGPLAEGVSSHVRWAVDTTEGRFDSSACQSFDVLAGHHEGLVRYAREHTKVYPKVVIRGVPARLLVSYAGIAESVHCVGACADLLHAAEKERHQADDLPIAIVVCGVLQPSSGSGRPSVHTGERIHISVRTEAPIDAEHIAEAISVSGGGRVGSAAAQLTVPEMCENMPVDEYMLLLMSYIEMRLVWPIDSWLH